MIGLAPLSTPLVAGTGGTGAVRTQPGRPVQDW
jgi:hypothetical protein